ILALFLIPFGRMIRSRWWIALALLPISLAAWFILRIPAVAGGEIILQQREWVPSLGLNFSFRLDGLSLLFSLLITVIGALIFIYTSSYLRGHHYLDRFYGYLSLFMAS